MAQHPCKEFIDCPGSDLLTNYSTEALEKEVFIDTNFGDLQDPPPLGNDWTASGCVSTCESSVSQEDADFCAQRQQIECQAVNQRRPSFVNSEQQCTVNCPDGTPFTGPIFPAGQVAGFSQAQADAIGHSFACNEAQHRKICLGSLSPSEACKGSSYSGQITANGGSLAVFPQANFWQITLGSLPAGLDFNGGFQSSNTVHITGTPTQSGTFTFTVQITAPNGDFVHKTFMICVLDITGIKDGILSSPYSVQLSSPCGKIPFYWLVTKGSLPPGLVLNSTTGIISGTPTSLGTFSFEITLQTNTSPAGPIRSTSSTIDNGFDPVLGPPYPPIDYMLTLSQGGVLNWTIPDVTGRGTIYLKNVTDPLVGVRYWRGFDNNPLHASGPHVLGNAPAFESVPNFNFIWISFSNNINLSVVSARPLPANTGYIYWDGVDVHFSGPPPSDAINHFIVERSESGSTNGGPGNNGTLTGTITTLTSSIPGTALTYTDPTFDSTKPQFYRLTGVTNSGFTFPYNVGSLVPNGQLVSGWPREGTTTNGNGSFKGVITDSAANVIAVGAWANTINFGAGDLHSTFSNLVTDGFITKYSPNGDLIWTKQIGSNGNDSVQSVTVDDSDNIIVVGYMGGPIDFGGGVVTPYGSTNMFVLKLSPTGDFIWVQHYKSIFPVTGTGVDVDPSGNIIVGAIFGYGADFGGTGQTGGSFQMTPAGGAADADFAVAKLDPNTGLTQWAVGHGGTHNETLSAVTADQSGDVYVTGYVQGPDTNLGGGTVSATGVYNIFAAKYSGIDGSYVWGKLWGNSGGNRGYGIAADRTTGNIVLVGKFGGFINFGGGQLPTSSGTYILGLDTNGNWLWNKNSGGPNDFQSTCLLSRQADDIGRRLIVGGAAQEAIYWGGPVSLLGNGQGDPWVAAFTLSGNSSPTWLWSYMYGQGLDGAGATTACCVDYLNQSIVAGFFLATLDFGGVQLTAGTSGYNSAFIAKYT